MQIHRHLRVSPTTILLLGILFVGISAMPGCVGISRHIKWIIQGNPQPAEYTGLKGKRVAVVCVSAGSEFGPNALSNKIAAQVSLLVRERGKKVDVIDQEEIIDWMDRNDWNSVDYREVGSALDADMVLAIDLASYSLQEGSTLFKGRADAMVSVYDMRDKGRVVFERDMSDFTYPKEGGIPQMGNERKFPKEFMRRLSKSIAELFYATQVYDHHASDSNMAGLLGE